MNQAPPANPPAPDPGVFGRYRHTATGGTTVVGGLGGLVTAQAGARTPPARAVEFANQVQLISGNLSDVVEQHLTTPAAAPEPGTWIEVKRDLPRFFYPTDPILLIEGGRATFKHKPGSFSKDGLLYCRLTGDAATGLSCLGPAPAAGTIPSRVSVQGADLLERGIEHGGVPPECEDLLRELAVLDPGTSIAAAHAAAGSQAPAGTILAFAQNFAVEQTAWHATRDPRVDQAPLIALSGISGRLPSPIAVALPAHPWNPIRLDWRIQYLPSLKGIDDWRLDEIDYQPERFETSNPVVFESNCLLTQASNNIVAAAIRKALEQAASAGGSGIVDPNLQLAFFSSFAQKAVTAFQAIQLTPPPTTGSAVPAVDRLPLEDIASALSDLDLLTGGLDGLNTLLRGGFPGDGASQPGPHDPAPKPFFSMRSGFLRFTQLRLIDCFGQFVDLLASASGAANSSAIIKSDPMILPDKPDLVALPPRFTSPARLTFRFMDGGGATWSVDTDAPNQGSPPDDDSGPSAHMLAIHPSSPTTLYTTEPAPCQPLSFKRNE